MFTTNSIAVARKLQALRVAAYAASIKANEIRANVTNAGNHAVQNGSIVGSDTV